MSKFLSDVFMCWLMSIVFGGFGGVVRCVNGVVFFDVRASFAGTVCTRYIFAVWF